MTLRSLVLRRCEAFYVGLHSVALVQACVWTDDCQREGCTTRCITNWEVTESWSVLLDRSFGDGFYTACPELAFYINNVLKDVRGPGWQLSSQIVRAWAR